MNNYTKAMIMQMARKSGLELSSRHMAVLSFTYDYYVKKKVAPVYHAIECGVGVTRVELETLFPQGLFSIYYWLGIPVAMPGRPCSITASVSVENYRDIYLDHNATTPLRPEIKKILSDYINNKYGFGNPSSPTLPGKEAYEHIYSARVQLSELLKVSPYEIIFTSGGTEANNIAIKGVAFKYFATKGHIISSKTEHASVLETLGWLKTLGFEVTLLDVEKSGLVNPDDIKKAVRNNTILVAIMAVNNEIGTINPLEEIGMICSERNIPFFVDAVQAFGRLKLEPKKKGISLLSLSGHKIYAPKGIGALFIDKNCCISPLIHGGGQEFGLRSGTENVGYIMALSKAAKLVYKEMTVEHGRLTSLRNLFLDNLCKHVPGFIINGTLDKRLPNNLSVGFPGVSGGSLLLSMNQIGVHASSGAACSAGAEKPSHVIKALNVNTDAYGIIRFSFGLENSNSDVEYLFSYLPEILTQLRTATKNHSA